MPSFRYQALASDGAMQNGTIVATDRATAMRMIQQKGETPLDLAISDTDAVGGITKARPTISRSDLADLVRELATALEAGLPLMQALRTVRRQASNKNLRVILDFIIARVEAGVPFHTAAKEYGAPFDDMTTGMLRAADASGRTSEILHQLGDLLERGATRLRGLPELVRKPICNFRANGLVGRQRFCANQPLVGSEALWAHLFQSKLSV